MQDCWIDYDTKTRETASWNVIVQTYISITRSGQAFWKANSTDLTRLQKV